MPLYSAMDILLFPPAAAADIGSIPSSIAKVRSIEIVRFMVFVFMFISSFVSMF